MTTGGTSSGGAAPSPAPLAATPPPVSAMPSAASSPPGLLRRAGVRLGKWADSLRRLPEKRGGKVTAILLVVVILPAILYFSYGWHESRWLWESRISPESGGMKLSLHSHLQLVELTLFKPASALRVRLARDTNAQQAAVSGAANKDAGLECSFRNVNEPTSDPAVFIEPMAEPWMPVFRSSRIRCSVARTSGDDMIVTIALDLKQEEVTQDYIDLLLVPFETGKIAPTQSLDRLRWAPRTLRWHRVRWQTVPTPDSAAQTAGATSQGCLDTAKPECELAREILHVRQEVLIGDAQQSIAHWASGWFSKSFAPKAVAWMVGVDMALLGLIIIPLFHLWRWGREGVLKEWYERHHVAEKRSGASSSPAASRTAESRLAERLPPVLPIEDVARTWRHVLEILEVSGPALGFFLTVCALLIAFDPSVFVDQDMNRFGSAISLGMTATAAGLAMRVLAFLHDRLFEMAFRAGGKDYRVDPFGFVHRLTEPAPAEPSAGGSETKPATMEPDTAGGMTQPAPTNTGAAGGTGPSSNRGISGSGPASAAPAGSAGSPGAALPPTPAGGGGASVSGTPPAASTATPASSTTGGRS